MYFGEIRRRFRIRRPVSRRITLVILAATLGFVGIISLFAPKIPLPVFAQTTAVASDAANEELPADFKLGEERTVTIQGKVLLPDGSPAGETFLYFNQLSAFKNCQDIQATDKDGNFTVKGVHVGAYSTAVMTQPQKPGGPADSLASPVIATIITDPPTPGQFDIQLQKGIKVHGKLIYEDGSPAVDKFISFITYPFGKKNIITHKEANLSSGASISACCGAKTNDRGEYTKMLVPGEYTVSQSDRFENDTEQLITLKPEEQERRIDLTLPNPTKGQIVLPDGSPAANLQINYISLSKINGCLSSQTTSDKNGNFSLNLSPYGNMLQTVTKDGKFGLVKYIKGDERLKPLTLTLQPPVIGKVRLVSRSGKPVAGLPLYYAPLLHTGENSTHSSLPVNIVTDSDGNAELTQLFVGGEYRLSCRVPDNVHSHPVLDIPFNPAIPGEVIDIGEKQIVDDFFQFVTKIPVASDAANENEAKAEAFRCFVKDEDKKPIAGAKVVVQLTSVENSKNTELRLVSGADGSFQFPVTAEQASHPELILHVEAAHPDYISLSFINEKFSTFRDFYQLSDNTIDTAIQLYRSAKVSGTVLTREGKPAASVLVYASSQYKAHNNAQTKTRTDNIGKFVIGTLPGKDRLLWILPNDAAPLSLQLEEKDADLGTLRLQNGVVLEGRAVDADGKPAPNVWLSLLLKDSPGVRRHGHDACCRDAVSDAEGRFRFHPVMPGQYVLDSGFLMEYDRYNNEFVPESAYVNLGNVQLWADHPIAQPKLPAKNETIPFVKQEITLTDQAVQKVEYITPAMFDLTIRTTNDFMKNHQNLKWIVRGEFQGQNWEYEKKLANPAETVAKIKIPVGLKKGYLELFHEVTMAGHYFPLRFRLPKQEKWSNNWYATLGDLDSSLPQSIDVEPYEPGVLKVACFEPDGKPLRQNTIQVKYKNVDFSDPKIITINGKEIGTGIERHSPRVEFGVLDGLPVMWRYRPVLADEEFILSADGFNETERFKPVTETLILKSGEQRELKVKLKEKVEKKTKVSEP
ncbi:hypothetical protein FACS1894214_2600 [Planctomycetales bacterium]|nr:hypothetical protein FACS1894214_2600 [Planctomycetales bacterium]